MLEYFRKSEIKLYLVFFVVLLSQIVFSTYARPIKSEYMSVPYPPSIASATIQYLGDKDLAYRAYGIMIQNFGDTGGNHTPLKNYDFDLLAKWFFLEENLDNKSNYIPFIASYYFGASQDPSKLLPIINYLREVGKGDGADKWRWLSQAVYLSRFRMNDNALALEIAYELSAIYKPSMPAWTRHMPAFIKLNMGDKKASYIFMIELLKSESENMHPSEINFMVDYICKRTLTHDESLKDPLCAEFH